VDAKRGSRNGWWSRKKPEISRGATITKRRQSVKSNAHREKELSEHFLKTIREEREKLLDRVNEINRLEVSQLKMMGKDLFWKK